MTDTILVTGHRNPDMDAIASAVGYAWLLSMLGAGEYTAGRPGDINSQTAFALDHFGVQAPPLVAEVAPARQVVMVDHNELEQSVIGLDAAAVIEILDHHRLATITTTLPIRVTIDAVGSCSTLVSERAAAEGVTLPAGIAGVLLCGILSDTLVFRSPTTTPREHAAARRLAIEAGLAPADASKETVIAAIQAVGEPLLNASAGIGDRPAEEIVGGDLKFFEQGAYRFGIVQIEVTNLSDLPRRLGDLKGALTTILTAESLILALLMVTDVVRGDSQLVAVGDARVLAALPYPLSPMGTLDAPGMMSRKKQLLPAVLEAVATLG